MSHKRIKIITGHYGSGKTEFAVNYAIELKKAGGNVAISDMDIVNVYFRSREKQQELESKGIKFIASSIEGKGLDVPAISAATIGPIIDKDYTYVMDLGGNNVGTSVLGRVRERIDIEELEFLMVINVYRPETSTVELILSQIESIESAAKLKITGLVNNSNLVRQTDISCLIKGDEIIKEVSRLTGKEIKYHSYIKALIKENIPEYLSGEGFPMEFKMRESWM